jgi:hypothetical protein
MIMAVFGRLVAILGRLGTKMDAGQEVMKACLEKTGLRRSDRVLSRGPTSKSWRPVKKG